MRIEVSLVRQMHSSDVDPYFNIKVHHQMEKIDSTCDEILLAPKKATPAAPPLPGSATTRHHNDNLLLGGLPLRRYSWAKTYTRDTWERLFYEGYRADVSISTTNGDIIYAHSNILPSLLCTCLQGLASPVLKGMLKRSKRQERLKAICIRGVPHVAVHFFVRFLYTSCYQHEEMNEHALQLLVLSHAYVIPNLKRVCEQHIERHLLNTESVVDIFQLALLCDVPRLGLICHRMILNNFKAVASTDGWIVMKQSHPILEKELLETVVAEENKRKERLRKSQECKIYLQLYEAMEALVHIYSEGCRTIGPHDKVFKEDQEPCNFAACKGLELLVRHFAGCKLRVPGGCIHCKRMWQLLELHSRLCTEPDQCRVPLCRSFKGRMRKQSKKDEIKWRILVRKILRAKSMAGGLSFSSAIAACAAS
ncbi:BTB/POZ domain [Dillenia turbinata]|uniref:BTB/POZ domain n=1 Tax=Dillenia turbinata TaxID=194707 RepID=A0AAN8V8E7_9MAGN